MLQKYYTRYIGRRGTQEHEIPQQTRHHTIYTYTRAGELGSCELEAGAAIRAYDELEAGQLRAGGCKLIGGTLELNQYRSETGNYQWTKILTIIRVKR